MKNFLLIICFCVSSIGVMGEEMPYLPAVSTPNYTKSQKPLNQGAKSLKALKKKASNEHSSRYRYSNIREGFSFPSLCLHKIKNIFKKKEAKKTNNAGITAALVIIALACLVLMLIGGFAESLKLVVAIVFGICIVYLIWHFLIHHHH